VPSRWRFLKTGKPILRNHINATVGFEKLGAAMHKSPKSLMRMFGERGTGKRRTVFCLRVQSEKRENQTCGTSRTGLRVAQTPLWLDHFRKWKISSGYSLIFSSESANFG
jgi:hypothetical protein